MSEKKDKLLIVQVAGLGHQFLQDHGGTSFCGLEFQPAESVFPAVTCSVQASFRTALQPSGHGMIANGLFDRRLRRPMFWEQSSALVEGARIWDEFRESGRTVGMLFWQQSLGESADIILSPAPIHKHHGGMIEDCYCKPAGLYSRLCSEIGRPLRLRNYWGPMASVRSSQWIAQATAQVIASKDAPDLCLTYLPALDYELQRVGPSHARSQTAFDALRAQLVFLVAAAEKNGYELLVFGDYAIADCDRAVYPNRALADAGLLATRDVRGMLYPDFNTSRAFAMVDHEIAHVYVLDPTAMDETRAALSALDGVAEVMDSAAQVAAGIAHDHAGELVLVATEGKWLAYPWWRKSGEAPDYASHVDIHNKPGYDPCELFFGWPPGSVSTDTDRIGGAHGRIGSGSEVAWASTCLDSRPDSIVDLAKAVGSWLSDRVATG